jgi:hypothetical protein
MLIVLIVLIAPPPNISPGNAPTRTFPGHAPTRTFPGMVRHERRDAPWCILMEAREKPGSTTVRPTPDIRRIFYSVGAAPWCSPIAIAGVRMHHGASLRSGITMGGNVRIGAYHGKNRVGAFARMDTFAIPRGRSGITMGENVRIGAYHGKNRVGPYHEKNRVGTFARYLCVLKQSAPQLATLLAIYSEILLPSR